jgi:ribosomal protein S18 acetylase RimI-like enzyme
MKPRQIFFDTTMEQGESLPMRQLSFTDLDRAVEIAVGAFHVTPLYRYLVPDDAKRTVFISKLYRAFYVFGIRRGQVYGVSEPLEGVAVWSLPGRHKGVFRGMLAAGLLPMCCGPMLAPILKSARIFTGFESLQRKYAPEPHYQLRSLAVAPESQGKGLASKLIRPFLAQADERSTSVYTETTVPANLGLYEHYGFECKEQYPVPGTGLHIRALYRPATRRNGE